MNQLLYTCVFQQIQMEESKKEDILTVKFFSWSSCKDPLLKMEDFHKHGICPKLHVFIESNNNLVDPPFIDSLPLIYIVC